MRALSPHIGAQLELEDGERLGVSRVSVVHGEVPAGVLAAIDGRMVLGCGEGALEILSVRPAGGKSMASADYLRGHPLPRTAPVSRA